MSSRTLAYLRLMRLPTVFTALADIFLGFLLTHPSLMSEVDPKLLPRFLLLCLSSAGLYLSGMVFNDYFDRSIDTAERPNRPIPCGAISAESAKRLAVVLMLIGIVAAGLAGVPSLVVAVSLSVMILGYDGGLKNTPLGPLAMGSCRFGNVLLGASAVAALADLDSKTLLIAAGLGTYIVGVTMFAKQEATVSRRSALIAAACVINAGVLGLAYFVNQSALWDNRFRALGVLVVVLVTLNRRLTSAISNPEPQRVQLAIKGLLLSLVMLDATLIYAFNGNEQLAMATVALLIPAIGFSRLIAMT